MKAAAFKEQIFFATLVVALTAVAVASVASHCARFATALLAADDATLMQRRPVRSERVSRRRHAAAIDVDVFHCVTIPQSLRVLKVVVVVVVSGDK